MKSRAFYRKDQFYIKVKMTDDVWSDMDDEMLNKVDEFEKHLSDKAWEMFTSFLNLPVSSLKAEIIDELDFKSLGCVLEVMPCPFYGTKNIYTLKGNYDSEKGTMDGFDTDYVIEQEKFQWVRIIKIDVGGFAGGETKSQIFHGIIKNKSELKRTLQQLGCVPADAVSGLGWSVGIGSTADAMKIERCRDILLLIINRPPTAAKPHVRRRAGKRKET